MADLTPNNREELWLQGMVDGQTTLEPNKRREYWYKEIVDAIGSGGGGGTGGGATVLNATLNDSIVTLPCTVGELFAAVLSSYVIVKLDYEQDGYPQTAIFPILESNKTLDPSAPYLYTFSLPFGSIEATSDSEIVTFNWG